MTRHTCLLSILLIGICVSVPAQVTQRIGTPVGLYLVQRLSATPKLDGKLDDPCWHACPPLTDFAAFGLNATQQGSFPLPATLRTTVRIGTTDAGLWLGFDCYEDDMTKMKATLQARDAGDLWTEDSIELYFGTDPRQLSYKKYIINALGTQGDERNLSGIVDHSWNDPDWRVKTVRLADRWTAEYFFPWKSLGGQPHAGEMLPLGITRFSWTTGNLVGACWGAAMSNPFIYRAGLLLFDDRFTDTLAQLADLQQRWRGDTWHLWIDNRLLTVTTLAADTRRTLAETTELLGDVRFELSISTGLASAKDLEQRCAILEDASVAIAKQPDASFSRATWCHAHDLLEQSQTLRDELRRDLLIRAATTEK
ncbi:MAG TPA: hypothetical protein VGL77_21430 [Armatimonadota bacterium]